MVELIQSHDIQTPHLVLDAYIRRYATIVMRGCDENIIG